MFCNGDETTFRYDLKASDDICFEESLPETIGVIIEVFSQTQTLTLKVFNPAGKVIYNRGNQQILKYPFTSYDGGIYKICLINSAKYVSEFSLSLKTGIDAKDYSELVTKKNLKPVELEAQKVEDTVKELHKSMRRTVGLESAFFRTQRRLKWTMISAGVLSIGFLVFTGALSY